MARKGLCSGAKQGEDCPICEAVLGALHYVMVDGDLHVLGHHRIVDYGLGGSRWPLLLHQIEVRLGICLKPLYGTLDQVNMLTVTEFIAHIRQVEEVLSVVEEVTALSLERDDVSTFCPRRVETFDTLGIHCDDIADIIHRLGQVFAVKLFTDEERRDLAADPQKLGRCTFGEFCDHCTAAVCEKVFLGDPAQREVDRERHVGTSMSD